MSEPQNPEPAAYRELVLTTVKMMATALRIPPDEVLEAIRHHGMHFEIAELAEPWLDDLGSHEGTTRAEQAKADNLNELENERYHEEVYAFYKDMREYLEDGFAEYEKRYPNPDPVRHLDIKKRLPPDRRSIDLKAE